eukprot:15447949-Alexandrium_andersonii.AAC.1
MVSSRCRTAWVSHDGPSALFKTGATLHLQTSVSRVCTPLHVESSSSACQLQPSLPCAARKDTSGNAGVGLAHHALHEQADASLIR